MAASFVLGQVFLPVGPVNYAKAQDVALEPVFSYLSATQDEKDTIGQVDTTTDISITGASLSPTISNCEAAGSVVCEESSLDQTFYTVRDGDTTSKIADMLGISENTLLKNNDMKKGDKLMKGDILIILPIDGIMYDVVSGDTLKKISEKYKIDVSDILAVNDMTLDTQLIPKQKLLIPGADVNYESVDKPTTNLAKKNQEYYTSQTSVKNTSGYFINPLPSGHLTQKLHDHKRAIDIGAPTGTPIRAAASGTVLFAKIGYNGGFGNLVILNHPNGTQTYYAHQSKLGVHVGEKVSQGEVIGYIGSTGHSTGPHLHFEVRNAPNPGLSWF